MDGTSAFEALKARMSSKSGHAMMSWVIAMQILVCAGLAWQEWEWAWLMAALAFFVAFIQARSLMLWIQLHELLLRSINIMEYTAIAVEEATHKGRAGQ